LNYFKEYDCSSGEFKRVGKFQMFQALDSAFDNIEKTWRKQANSQDYFEAIEQFRNAFIGMYESVNREQIPHKYLTELDSAAQEIVQSKWTSFPTPADSWRIGLELLYKSFFPSLTYEIADDGAGKFLKALECLKQKKFDKAREYVEEVYQIVEKLSELSTRQIQDYEYVMICALYLEQYATSLEEVELRAGMAIILNNLRSKIKDHQKVPRQIEPLDWSLKEYSLLRLDKEFPNSSWRQPVVFEDYLWPRPGEGLMTLMQQSGLRPKPH
ncbi:MAG: hypothetical protein K2X08_08105, partial [Chlamydiales bacterium]|nr:hypothetical protein [Chlamydiales bacterium]